MVIFLEDQKWRYLNNVTEFTLIKKNICIWGRLHLKFQTQRLTTGDDGGRGGICVVKNNFYFSKYDLYYYIVDSSALLYFKIC